MIFTRVGGIQVKQAKARGARHFAVGGDDFYREDNIGNTSDGQGGSVLAILSTPVRGKLQESLLPDPMQGQM